MGEPLYQIVYQAVLERIASGEYAPGTMLPSEHEIGASLGVSQGTARKALSRLEQKGVVRRKQGLGTFVTLRTPADALFQFYRLRDEDGNQVTPTLEREKIVHRPATEHERDTLFGTPDEVFEIQRYRTFRGRPVTFETSVVPSRLFPGLKERGRLPNAMYVLFQQAYACVIIEADEKLIAEPLGKARARGLDIDPNTPVIVGRRTSRDLLDRVVELRTNVYILKNAHYSVELR